MLLINGSILAVLCLNAIFKEYNREHLAFRYTLTGKEEEGDAKDAVIFLAAVTRKRPMKSGKKRDSAGLRVSTQNSAARVCDF